jgi:MFS family permease
MTAPGDWSEKYVGFTFMLFFIFLGSSAALFGSWLERNGPRKTGVVAAFCWGGGFFISALGVYLHQAILIWLGSGVIGGCGLGLGYISPVSTLIKWFPDKRGMATGMAIMGFGGGSIIGSPLAVKLMKYYSATSNTAGVWQTFVTLGCIYLVAMLCGAFMYRIPAPGWKPHGWAPPDEAKSEMITNGQFMSTKHIKSHISGCYGECCA